MASSRPSQGESGTAKAAGSIVLTDGTQMAAGSRNVARDGTRLAAMVPYSFRSKTNKVAPLASSRLPAHEHDTKALGAPSGDDGAAGIDGSSRSTAPPLRPVRGKLRAAPLGKATTTPGNSGASTPLLAKAVLERLRHLKCDPLFEDDVGQIANMETAERARKRHEIQAMLSGATATGDTEEAAAAAFGIEHYDLQAVEQDPRTEQFMEEYDDARSTASETSVDSFDDEVDRLGRNYKRFQFQPPSEERAKARARSRKFHRGNAPFCATSTNSFVSMGLGTLLYFKLLKMLVVTLCLMSLAALPTLIFAGVGSRISSSKMDSAGFAALTLGNIGGCTNLNTSSAITLTSVNCTSDTEPIALFGGELARTTASYIITACDAGYTALFMGAVFVLWLTINGMESDFEHKRVSIQRYAVHVTGLPYNATKDEVLAHFNNLYRLDQDMVQVVPRCCPLCPLQKLSVRSPPSFPVKPVSDVAYSQDERYKGTWVAEVEMVRPVHDAVTGYLQLRKRVHRLRAARARVQKYADNCEAVDPKTEKPYADPKKHKKAVKRLHRLQRKLDRIKNDLRSTREFSQGLEHVCIGAFVVFEHRESKRRCLEDYRQSAAWWGLGGCCVPTYLYFRGTHPLTVSSTAPPSDIMFENLGTPWSTLCCRRTSTWLVTALLLTCSFLIILLAKRSKSTFSVTPLSECSTDVTASVYGSYLPPSEVPRLLRNETMDGNCVGADCAPASERCPADHAYIWFEGAAAAAIKASGNFFGSDTCGEPCVPVASASQADCAVLACTDTSWQSQGYTCDPNSPTYPKGTRLGCFCWQLLQDTVDTHGWWSGGIKLWREEIDKPCGDFAVSWFTGNILSFLAAMVVAGTNGALQLVLRWVVKAERHVSQSAELAAFSAKLLLAQFTNTALVMLLVFNKLPNDASVPVLRHLGILEGTYTGFTSDWYPAVGVGAVITMMLNLLVPHGKPLFKEFVLAPMRRCCFLRKAVTQHEMDNLYAGSRWEIDVRYTFIMNTLFVALFFSSGMPILLPLAAASLAVTFFIDKYLLLRKMQRPPAFDSSQARWAVSLMPWAALLHLIMACFMYGENELLVSSVINPELVAGVDDSSGVQAVSQAYDTFLKETSSYDVFGLSPLVVRTNVFPLFLMFLVLLVILVFKSTIGTLLSCLVCHNKASRATKLAMQVGSRKAAGLRGSMPLTREYREVLADESSDVKSFQKPPRHLTKSEDNNGWLITKHGPKYILRKRMRRSDKYRTKMHGKAIKHGYIHQWDSSDSDGDEDFTARGGADTAKSEGSGASSVTESAFLPRQFKATWQVIADQHSSYSYHMYSIPRYMELQAVRNDFLAASGSGRMESARDLENGMHESPRSAGRSSHSSSVASHGAPFPPQAVYTGYAVTPNPGGASGFGAHTFGAHTPGAVTPHSGSATPVTGARTPKRGGADPVKLLVMHTSAKLSASRRASATSNGGGGPRRSSTSRAHGSRRSSAGSASHRPRHHRPQMQGQGGGSATPGMLTYTPYTTGTPETVWSASPYVFGGSPAHAQNLDRPQPRRSGGGVGGQLTSGEQDAKTAAAATAATKKRKVPGARRVASRNAQRTNPRKQQLIQYGAAATPGSAVQSSMGGGGSGTSATSAPPSIHVPGSARLDKHQLEQFLREEATAVSSGRSEALMSGASPGLPRKISPVSSGRHLDATPEQ